MPRVYLTDPDALPPPGSLWAMVEDHGMHVLSLTPALWPPCSSGP